MSPRINPADLDRPRFLSLWSLTGPLHRLRHSYLVGAYILAIKIEKIPADNLIA
jgi:hypothetical protein